MAVADDKAKILVVDDLAENLLSYQAILDELGQELVLVRSGEEALKEVLKSDFAVILLDVNMPGMDGLETAALIRKRKLSAHTPIIFITAFTDEVRINEGYAHGAVDFISSPVVPPILRAKVRVFVDLFRLSAQIRRHAQEEVAHAEERSRREAAEESNRRLTFLARAGAIMTKSLERQVTIESILKLMVPEHAAQAVIAEQDETGNWRHASARTESESLVLQQGDGIAEMPVPWQEAIERVFSSGLTEGAPLATSKGNGDRGAGLLALPLRDRDRVFGVLLLISEARTYAQADVAMFESVAWRAGIALLNARLYGEIERADQQKNRFLSMLAHELRNPLAPIRSAVDVLRLCGDSPTDIEWARDVIDRQVNHLIRLVDDLLDISRITLGKIRLQTETVNASEIVAAAVEISRPLIERSKHRLTVSLPDEPVLLVGDRARLTQVLANLLNNAAKYTPTGGAIDFSLDQEGDDAVFRLRDTGIGIPANMLEKVFDMFTQIDSGLDRSHGGLGIGLTLVRELVTMHQGSIAVNSDGPGQGSEFIMRIPAAGSSLREAAAIAEGQTPAYSGHELKLNNS
jgi:signal transduction histidine kinase/DNA-binding response OmpR family regulator